MTPDRPSPLQYVAYAYGKRLPDSMLQWVANDLAGDGAIRRHLIRFAIPPFLFLAPFWLIPASPYVHMEMTVPIYIWSVLMSLALNKIWRRHRLSVHGLDPNLVDELKRQREAHIHEEYARMYGPRPESAKWQANSSPF